MQAFQQSPRKLKKYGLDEVAVLNVHREMYRKLTTKEEREQMLQNNILGAIFCHWEISGEVTPEITEKELADWIKVRNQ